MAGLDSKDQYGNVVDSPSWALVVSYEHAIRAAALKRVKKGETFDQAHRAAMDDEVVKGRYFTTPLSIEVKTGGAKRGRGNQGRGADMVVYEETWQEPPRAWQEPPTKKGKGDEKKGGKKGDGKGGKKGGKGDGKVDALAHGCARQNKDGKLICFAFNSDGQLCRARKCKFLHVCGRCTTSNKPMYHCPCKA